MFLSECRFVVYWRAMIGEISTHESLLQRLAAEGDDGAWREFCDRYGRLIRGFARRRGLKEADCEDVLQDVLTALSQSMPGFRYDPAKGKFRSYLKAVVVRRVGRLSRQNPPTTRLEDVGGGAISRAGSEQAADEAWEEEWRQYHLGRAMRQIAREFAEITVAIFREYVIHNRRAPAVAEALGASLHQVYHAKARILPRLSEIVRTQIDEEG